MSSLNVEQRGRCPYEAFTVDNLFDDKIDDWKNLIETADPKNRTFTYSPFKNGKVILPEVSELVYARIESLLPATYADAKGQRWAFAGPTKYVMYAILEPGQSFPIHTDTGAEFSEERESKFTVLIYLNDDFEGGITQFYDDNFKTTFEITPKRGRTLIFDIDLFHAGREVDSGKKMWIGTELTDPVIDARKVSKWLDVSFFGLTKTLKESYKRDLDYIVSENSAKKIGRGGHNRQIVLLTPDCFKRLCMRSRGQKAEQVRTYFIELESLVFKYKDQMIAGMEAEIKRLEKNMRPRDAIDSAGYIYVIRASESGDSVFKIGRAKDLNRRLDEYQTGHADLIEVVWKYRTDRLKRVEGCVHALLKEQRYKGCRRRCNEVYKIDLDDIKEIVSGCEKLSLKLEYSRRKPLTMTGGYYLVLRKET